MTQISYIKHKDILEARRFDAEYFRPESLENEYLIENQKNDILINICDIKGGKRLPLGETFSDEGIPYVRAEDVRNTFVDYKNSPKISLELHNRLKNYQTKFNDVLITIVGNSIGEIGFVKFDLDKCNLTENCAKFTNIKIIPDYLFSFLLSKYGQFQVSRERVGTSQPKLALERIRKFKIPLLLESFQKEIEKLVKSSFEKQTKSKQLYKEAEELLLEELDLLDYKPKHTLIFSAFKKEIDQTERIDAEYYQPKYTEVMERIKKNNKKLGDLVEYSKGIEVGSEAYSDSGKSFLRVADFSSQGIGNVGKKISVELFEKLKKSYSPKKNEILFTKDGTIGLAYALDEDLEVIVSGAFLRLIIQDKNIDKEYLTLVLNSLICKMQIEQVSGGALIAHLKPSDAMKLLIPIISTNKRKQISEKVILSKKLRKESKDLLEEAKRKVEEEIEKQVKK